MPKRVFSPNQEELKCSNIININIKIKLINKGVKESIEMNSEKVNVLFSKIIIHSPYIVFLEIFGICLFLEGCCVLKI